MVLSEPFLLPIMPRVAALRDISELVASNDLIGQVRCPVPSDPHLALDMSDAHPIGVDYLPGVGQLLWRQGYE
ncbi:hypothetical protein LGM58_43195 [Burkholderia contaminans]|uniref:hypothetical protein n=1 Tax=Burkholderia contaminans TaxID=488447 RepID=UPI001CF5E26A|nr:hypothetical protein [Burkholderia contaminans]MCA7889983.1 hypothetical protein [Burkholderia contaminans]